MPPGMDAMGNIDPSKHPEMIKTLKDYGLDSISMDSRGRDIEKGCINGETLHKKCKCHEGVTGKSCDFGPFKSIEKLEAAYHHHPHSSLSPQHQF